MKRTKCKCNCGYTCGGPGVCELFAKDVTACISEHYKKDCEHDWNGPHVKLNNGIYVTCTNCDMLFETHAMRCGI